MVNFISLFIVFFFVCFLQTAGLWCFTHDLKKKNSDQRERQYLLRGTKDAVRFSQEYTWVRAKINLLKTKNISESYFPTCYFNFFHFKGCSKVLNFLPIYVNSLSNICSTVANFPAKIFGKNLVLNTYAPIFFLFFPFFLML